jgi:uncharacterized protein (TIGR03437 family)
MHPRRLLRGGALLLATLPLTTVAPALAQISQITATEDGQQVYFTSRLVLKGAASSIGEYRLYRWTGSGVSLFAERGPLAAAGGSSSDGVSNPVVSADGSIVGFTFNDVCPSGSNCIQPVNQAVVRGRLNESLGIGNLQLSRDGRWALVTVSDFDSTVFPPVTTYSSTLRDLNTGELAEVPPPPSGTSDARDRFIASGGSVVVKSDSGVGLWKQGQVTPVPIPAAINARVIGLSDDARTLFLSSYTIAPTPGMGLVAMDVATGKLTTVFQAADSTQLPSFMGASSDGRTVLYRYGFRSWDGQAFVFDAASGVTTAVELPSGELVTDGTITGGGDVAFFATTSGRIVRYDIASRVIEGLFGPTPYCDVRLPLSTGSFASLKCNFSLPVSELTGHLLLDGIPMPILDSKPDEIDVQVPWKTHTPYNTPFSITLPNDSPFQAEQPISVFPMLPAFASADPGSGALLGLKLVKSDWSGLLTSQPSPGDIFYAYMTGLGPVDGTMKDGVPAPLSPAPILGSLTCAFSAQGSPAKTLFAGLAPETVGFYQVAFQLPADAGPQPISLLNCSWSDPWGGSGVLKTFGNSLPAGIMTPSVMMKSLPDDRRRQ